MSENRNRGFIALMSAIIISVVLLLIASSGALTGFFSRFNLLETEFKERGTAIAEACADEAILELVTDPTYSGNATTTVSSPSGLCYIGAIDSSVPNQKSFKTRAIYQNTFTTMQVSVDSINWSILSWKELATF